MGIINGKSVIDLQNACVKIFRSYISVQFRRNYLRFVENFFQIYKKNIFC